MVLKTSTFNHEADSLQEAIGIPSNVRERSREKIIFSVIANHLQGRELYEDEDSIPAEFHTMTGDLARTLSLITDPYEYEFTLLTFTKIQDLANETVQKYRFMNSSSDKDAVKKMNLLTNLQDLMIQFKMETDEDNPTPDATYLSPKSLMERIDLVKSSHYSWETYYNMVKSKNFITGKKKASSGSDFDIDDILRGIMGNDSE